MTDAVNETLAERHKTHGDFRDVAELAQGLKLLMHQSKNWERMSDVQREGIEMNLHKLARIGSGNPDEPDHWKDIAGYAMCVHDRLPGRK
jgi:hypothetical protein